MAVTQWFVLLNPSASEMFAQFLSAKGEGSGRDTHNLTIGGESYPAWMVLGSEIDLLQSMHSKRPDVFSEVRFAKQVGNGQPRFADFFGRGRSTPVRKTFTGVALEALKLAQEVAKPK